MFVEEIDERLDMMRQNGFLRQEPDRLVRLLVSGYWSSDGHGTFRTESLYIQ